MTANPPPPPPASPAPPPPSAPAPASGASAGKQTDNPIAVAGLLVSLLGAIASVAIVGGFIGIVGFVLSSIGLKRSKLMDGRGRGSAIGGIVLGLFSILASAGFVVLYFSAINGGDEIIRDGIATHSTNTEFPPQDDVLDFTCEASGSSAVAIVDIENMSAGPSLYAVTVEWETASGGTIEGIVRSEMLDPGDTITLRLIESSGIGLADSCTVTTIERSGIGLLGG